MKALTFAASILILVLISSYSPVVGADSTVYVIQISSDGSALWTVTQILDVNSSFETLETLQNRVNSLAAVAENVTGRSMSASADSLAFTQISSSYIEAQYKFAWENFSQLEDSSIFIGDVYRTAGFFDRLFGDGEVQVTYPSQFNVESVEPAPYVRNDSVQTLEWLGTNDFQNNVKIVLTEENVSWSFVDSSRSNIFLVVGLIAVAAVSLFALFSFRRVRRKKKVDGSGRSINLLVIENDEDKVVKLIKSAGGSLHQSSIKDQLGFSKAKTSQLLSELERKGAIARVKKGRDKIVVIKERSKGESS